MAIKLSFSELGNTAYLRPSLVRPVVRVVKDCGGKPFLTDANTLYTGGWSNSPDHIETAIKNGFSYAMVEAPIIIADGLRGKSYVDVRIDQKNCKTARIGTEAYHADAMIGRVEDKIKKYVGMGILSQAGVAIGLSLIIQKDFSELAKKPEVAAAVKALPAGEKLLYGPLAMGAALMTTITATCVLFEIVGPILTKIALRKAGEIPDSSEPPTA